MQPSTHISTWRSLAVEQSSSKFKRMQGLRIHSTPRSSKRTARLASLRAVLSTWSAHPLRRNGPVLGTTNPSGKSEEKKPSATAMGPVHCRRRLYPNLNKEDL